MNKRHPVSVIILIIWILAFGILVIFPNSTSAFEIKKKEIQFGFCTDRSLISSYMLVLNDRLNDRITEIGQKVAAAGGPSNIEYKFRVINDPTINAFAAAGGFVYVNTGLLDILESPDELAFILGHEISHINKSHQIGAVHRAHTSQVAGFWAEALLSTLMVAAGAYAMNIGEESPSQQYNYDLAMRNLQESSEILGSLFGEALTCSLIKGYGRKQELDADTLGLQYAQKAGYDPEAALRVLGRLMDIRGKLRSEEGTFVSNLINSEPGLEERISKIKETLNIPEEEESESK